MRLYHTCGSRPGQRAQIAELLPLQRKQAPRHVGSFCGGGSRGTWCCMLCRLRHSREDSVKSA